MKKRLQDSHLTFVEGLFRNNRPMLVTAESHRHSIHHIYALKHYEDFLPYRKAMGDKTPYDIIGFLRQT